MRIAAYNIQHGARGVEWVGGIIRDIAADVTCINEVTRPQLRPLAQFAGRGSWHGGALFGGMGNAILSRRDTHATIRKRLSRSPGLERRSLLGVEAGGLTITTTHLGLVGEERLRHAREILDALPPSGRLVLAGDLNEEPDGPAVALLMQRFDDAFMIAGEGRGETFPSSGPRQRIDYVLVSGVRVISCEVIEALAADHRPVVAEIVD